MTVRENSVSQQDRQRAFHRRYTRGEQADSAHNLGVTECVKGMSGKYVLYDGKTAYILSDQNAPEKFAAQKVIVIGTLEAKTKTIQVERITQAK